MSTWESVERELYDSSRLRKELTDSDKEGLRDSLYNLAQTYNIPGISNSRTIGITSQNSDGFATVSNVGGNIRSLEMNGKAVYSYGADPFIVPLLRKDDTGFYWDISTPPYYRHLGYTGSPGVNQFTPDNSDIPDLPEGFDTGHHGVTACLISDLEVNDGMVSHTTIHNQDRTNLNRYARRTTSGFDEEGRFVETLEFSNPNGHSIPFSALRHPYFYLNADDFETGKIAIVDQDGSAETIYELEEYRERSEASFVLPTLDKGKYVQLQKADGSKVNISFEGDYKDSDSMLQIFSNGYTTGTLVGDFEHKHDMYEDRIARLIGIEEKFGIDTSWYQERNRDFELTIEMMKKNRMAAISIEDGIASKNNIFQSKENLQTARILLPKQTVRFTRKTWVE